MYSKKKPIQAHGWLSLSHIGFSTLEDTVAEMYVLAPEFYIFCEVGLFCFDFFCGFLSLTVLAKRTLFNLQFKTSKIFKSVLRAEIYFY